jgi:hypothetical protein
VTEVDIGVPENDMKEYMDVKAQQFVKLAITGYSAEE